MKKKATERPRRTTATIGKKADGTPNRKEFTGKTKKEAKEKKKKFLEVYGRPDLLNYTNMTLGEAIHHWLFNIRYYANISHATFDRDEGIYRNYIKNTELNDWIVLEVTTPSLQVYYNKLFEETESKTKVHNLNRLIRKFYNYILSLDLMSRNPCKGIIPPEIEITENNTRMGLNHGIILSDVGNIEDLEFEDGDIGESKEIKPYSHDEIRRIRENFNNDTMAMIVLVALGTGMRQGEILGLAPKHIDLEGKTIKVMRTLKKVKIINKDGSHKYEFVIKPPKTKHSRRIISIPSALIPALRKHINAQKLRYLKNGLPFNDNSLLFTTEACNPIDAKNLLRSWQRLQKRAGVEYRKFHNLRHTFATKLFESDVPLKTVSTLLGHSSIVITANIYTHVMPHKKTESIELLNDILL